MKRETFICTAEFNLAITNLKSSVKDVTECKIEYTNVNLAVL